MSKWYIKIPGVLAGTLILFAILLGISKCGWWYSGEHEGRYELNACIFKNGDTCNYAPAKCFVELKPHSLFTLGFMDTLLIKGKWKFYDTGDHAIIELYSDDSKFSQQCFAGRSTITPLNPHLLLGNPDIRSVQFEKVSNHSKS